MRARVARRGPRGALHPCRAPGAAVRGKGWHATLTKLFDPRRNPSHPRRPRNQPKPHPQPRKGFSRGAGCGGTPGSCPSGVAAGPERGGVLGWARGPARAAGDSRRKRRARRERGAESAESVLTLQRDLAQNRRACRGREVRKRAIFVLRRKANRRVQRSRDWGSRRKQKRGGQELDRRRGGGRGGGGSGITWGPCPVGWAQFAGQAGPGLASRGAAKEDGRADASCRRCTEIS